MDGAPRSPGRRASPTWCDARQLIPSVDPGSLGGQCPPENHSPGRSFGQSPLASFARFFAKGRGQASVSPRAKVAVGRVRVKGFTEEARDGAGRARLPPSRRHAWGSAGASPSRKHRPRNPLRNPTTLTRPFQPPALRGRGEKYAAAQRLQEQRTTRSRTPKIGFVRRGRPEGGSGASLNLLRACVAHARRGNWVRLAKNGAFRRAS